MQPIAVALVMAALAGLGGLAFKRPKIFIQLHTKLQVTIVVIYIAVSIYSLAFSLGGNTALRFVDSSRVQEAEAAIDGRSVSFWWIMLAYGGLTAFLHFLHWLAVEVEKEEEGKRPVTGED